MKNIYTYRKEIESGILEVKDYKDLAKSSDSIFVKSAKVDKICPNTHIQLYTDGSFKKALSMYTSGIVLVQNNQPKTFIMSKGNFEPKLKSNNIGGECNAVELIGYLGLEKVFKPKDSYKPTMEIICDLEHVKKWSTGEYKAKSYCAIRMRSVLEYLEKFFNINYKWVRGHDGTYYNEIADMLCDVAYYI